jgi:hypothetical protein
MSIVDDHDPMQVPLLTPDLVSPIYFNKHVKVQGFVRSRSETGCILEDIAARRTLQNASSITIEASGAVLASLIEGSIVLVEGVLERRKNRCALIASGVMDAAVDIPPSEAVSQTSSGPTWFTSERLSELRCQSSGDMIDLLKRNAQAEDFELCATAVIHNSSNRLECARHRNGPGRVGCPFFIRIQVHHESFRRPSAFVCVVTKTHRLHDHANNPLIYAHLSLSRKPGADQCVWSNEG